MFAKALIVAFGLLAMFILAAGIFRKLWFPAILQFLADQNILITRVEEGTAKAIMHFGKFTRFVMKWENHYFDTNWNVIEGHPGDPGKPAAAPAHPMDKFLEGGLAWVGWIGFTVYEYHFQWTSTRQGKLGSGQPTPRGFESIVVQGELVDLLISRDEDLDYAFLKQDVYGITFQDTEEKDMVPMAFIALLTGQIVNPYWALFETEQWLEQIMNFLRRYIKEYVAKNTFLALVTDANNGARAESEEILGYTSPFGNPIRDYIHNKWGFKIEHLNLVNFKTSGARGEAYEAAAATEFTETQRAKGLVKISEADGKRIVILAKAEAEGIKLKTDAVAAGGEIALSILTLETYDAMAKGGGTTVLGGTQPVQMLLESTRKQKLIQAPSDARKER